MFPHNIFKCREQSFVRRCLWLRFRQTILVHRLLDSFDDPIGGSGPRKLELRPLRMSPENDIGPPNERVEHSPLHDFQSGYIVVFYVLRPPTEEAPIEIHKSPGRQNPDIIVPIEYPIHKKNVDPRKQVREDLRPDIGREMEEIGIVAIEWYEYAEKRPHDNIIKNGEGVPVVDFLHLFFSSVFREKPGIEGVHVRWLFEKADVPQCPLGQYLIENPGIEHPKPGIRYALLPYPCT